MQNEITIPEEVKLQLIHETNRYAKKYNFPEQGITWLHCLQTRKDQWLQDQKEMREKIREAMEEAYDQALHSDRDLDDMINNHLNTLFPHQSKTDNHE